MPSVWASMAIGSAKPAQRGQWIARRRHAGHSVGSLIPPLFLAGNEPALAEEGAVRLMALADALEGRAAPLGSTSGATSQLQQRIITAMDSLDADLAPAPLLGQHSAEVAANPW